MSRRELAWLAGILVAAAALLIFALLAGEVIEGDTLAFDRWILLALRSSQNQNFAIGPHWLGEAAQEITALGSTPVLTGLTLAVAGYLALMGLRSSAFLVLASVVGGTALSSMLKLWFQRPRPELVPHTVQVYTTSFPSGHAMLSAVTYLTLGALLMRVQSHWMVKAYVLALAVLTTLLVGSSRVYLGVHWPTDVLAGWCIGAGWALICGLVAMYLQRGGHVDSASLAKLPSPIHGRQD